MSLIPTVIILIVFLIYQGIGYGYFISNRSGIMIKKRFVNLSSLLFFLLTIYGCFSILRLPFLATDIYTIQPCSVIYFGYHLTVLPAYTLLIFRSAAFTILYQSHQNRLSPHLRRFKNMLFYAPVSTGSKNRRNLSTTAIVHELPNSVLALLCLVSYAWSILSVGITYAIFPNDFNDLHNKYPDQFDVLCQGNVWYSMILFMGILCILENICAYKMWKINDGFYISREIILLLTSDIPIFIMIIIIWGINRTYSLEAAKAIPTIYLHFALSIFQTSVLIHFPAYLQWKEYRSFHDAKDQRTEFNKIILNPVLCKRLKQLSEERLCSELFKFLEYYEDFKSDRITEADMLKFFIVPDSPFWLNISQLIQKRIEENDYGYSFWTDVKREVVDMIFDNLFSLYIERYAISGIVDSENQKTTDPGQISAAQLSQFI